VEIAAGAKEVRRDIALARNSVRGIVVDAAGAPVEGVEVHAVASGRNSARATDLGEALSAVGGQAETGEDGRFAIEDMNPGSYTLRVAGEKGSAILEGVVAGEGGAEVRLALVPGVEVTVRVVDAEGKPVAGAGVYLADPLGIDLSGIGEMDEARTGADGRVSVTVPPGAVLFEAIVAGHAPGSTTASPEPGAEVLIALPRGATLEVLVLDAGGSPVAGAGIRLLDAAGKPYAPRVTMEGLGEVLASPATGSDGKYLRADLPAGTWTARAAAGERTAEASVAVAAGERKTITVRLP
jgi:protocatechuate 3,4-dioxygenase beta subunit